MSALAEKFSPSELAEAAARLQTRDLEQLVRELLALRAQRQAPRLSSQETELLLEINRRLSPEARARLQALIAHRDAQLLSPNEQVELVRLMDEIENRDSRRIQSLIQLAQLRGKPLQSLMDELGIQSPPVIDIG